MYKVGDRVKVIDQKGWSRSFREQVVRCNDLVVYRVFTDEGYIYLKRLSGQPVWQGHSYWSVWHGHLIMANGACPMEIKAHGEE